MERRSGFSRLFLACLGKSEDDEVSKKRRRLTITEPGWTRTKSWHRAPVSDASDAASTPPATAAAEPEAPELLRAAAGDESSHNASSLDMSVVVAGDLDGVRVSPLSPPPTETGHYIAEMEAPEFGDATSTSKYRHKVKVFCSNDVYLERAASFAVFVDSYEPRSVVEQAGDAGVATNNAAIERNDGLPSAWRSLTPVELPELL